ncbi:MAG: RPA family protein [Natronomonas sp.]|jgi:RPA family protein|uniref:RPA family protein n=1 Tax=Natronomonas sp. TaxID=2184060 RepID=UPI0039E4901D
MSQSGPGRREVAYRLFAAEFDDAEFSYSESDEERAPNYVVTPTGARVNRLFVVGVLTEVDDVNPEMVRGRVVDPTGAFVTYAGQYQPDELAFLERADPPTFLSLSGKARTFEPDDGDQVFTSIRPESVSEVDVDTRDRWVVTTAERTLERIGIMASAIEAGLAGDQLRAALEEEGVDERLADGVALALEYYGTTPAYLHALRQTALDAARVVAGDKEEAGQLEVAPGEGGGPERTADASELATLDLSGAPSPETAAAAAEKTEATEAETEAEPSAAEAETVGVEADTEAETEAAVETETEPETESEAEPETVSTDAGDESEPTDIEESEVEEPGPEPEPVAEPEEEAAPEPGEVTASEDELEDFEPGEFELDEEERREVEEEYGTEFSTAGEVEEAGIETPEPEIDEEGEPGPEPPGAEAEGETEPETKAEAETEETELEAEPAAGEVDLEDAVMETMESLSDDDGADREELVSAVVEEHGVAAEAVDDAIQDALMSGRCYEPSDGVLKSI